MKYNYASEKFSTAVTNLMLPHPSGEARSIADAFHECSLGLRDLSREDFPDYSIDWYIKLMNYMDTKGIDDPKRKGTYLVKAESFSVEEKIEISHIISELSWWFSRADDE